MMNDLPICAIGMSPDPVWNTLVRVPTCVDELPRPEAIDDLFLDFETTSEQINIPSINPHRNCKILGVAALFNNEPIPYYVPVRHAYLDENDNYCYRTTGFPNLPVDAVHDWLKYLFKISKRYINHNLKYDIHVLKNEVGVFPSGKLIDTLCLSKLANFEERFSYGLTEMMSLLGIDISPYEEVIKRSLGKKVKDYGLIPPDLMAPYAAVDTLCVRHLLRELRTRIHPECDRVTNIELSLTDLLVQIEHIGIRCDPEAIKDDWRYLTKVQTKRVKRIKKESGLKIFDPGKKDDLEELFQEKLGWSIDLTDGTKKKIEQYGYVPDKDVRYSYSYSSIFSHFRKHKRIVASFLHHLEDEKLLSSFIMPYLENHIDGNDLMHTSFNQIVRTGRMSSGNPNIQQLPYYAKRYILPYTDDYALVEFDLSQIEFRVIAHYIGNKKCIKDFNENPDTDFHTWVAKMCGIPRKPAKNINFMLGYGGGKQKCIKMLSELREITGTLRTRTEIENRALDVYNAYHAALPELKPTQYRASDVARSRGYVRTLLGRHRYLHRDFCFKGFNSVCQGSAADIMKDITLRLRKFINIDCILHALVHDAWLFSIRKERLDELIPLIYNEICRPIEGVEFSIPILAEAKIGYRNWADCTKFDIRKAA